jgi:hypothetical protein
MPMMLMHMNLITEAFSNGVKGGVNLMRDALSKGVKVVSDKSGRLTSTSNKRAKKTITSCISRSSFQEARMALLMKGIMDIY